MDGSWTGKNTNSSKKNPELESVLLDGENIIFCSTAQDWKRNLEKLIQDEELRSYIGNTICH